MKKMKPGYVFGIVMVVIASILTITFAIQLMNDNSSPRAGTSPLDSQVKDGAPADDESAGVINKSEQTPVKKSDKADALRILRKFVPAFYGRTPELYAGSSEETLVKYRIQVKPYATDTFVSDFVTPLDSAVDQRLERDGVTVQASYLAYSLVGHFENMSEAEANFTVRFDLIDGSKPVQTYRADVLVTLVVESGAWQINTIHEL